MKLLAIEIDLDSFFDVNLIVFTTISFAFSVVVISFLVVALRPLNARARIVQGKIPEKINITYIRMLIYGFAQFIAFVTDVFLVIFGHNYKLPWFTTSVFLTLIFYKLVYVLFKDFRDLGYNAKGITSTLKVATKIASDKNFESITDTLEQMPMNEKVNNEKKSKIRYKANSMGNKVPYILLLIIMIFSCKTNQYAYAPNYMTKPKFFPNVEYLQRVEEIKEPEEVLNQKIRVKWKGEWIDMVLKVEGKDLVITKT